MSNAADFDKITVPERHPVMDAQQLYGLFGRIDTGRGGYGGSRDFFIDTMPCECSTCHCNDGRGKCAVPSKIQIGADGMCKTGKEAINREHDEHNSRRKR